MRRIAWWIALLSCACGDRSPWDPAVDESPSSSPEAHGLESAPFDLANIVGDGAEHTHALGDKLAAIGDFDGDGFPDIASGVTYQEVLVAFGGGPPPPRASQLRAGEQGMLVVPETDDWFTIGDLDGAGDFDGDGHDDLLVGLQQVPVAPTEFENRAYVVFGGQRPTAPLHLADVAAGHGGTMLEGFGVWGASGVGDVDADGYADIALTGPSALERDEEGVAYVVRGRPGPAVIQRRAFREGMDGYTLQATRPDLKIHRVDGCGDVDGDGRHDLLVSGYRVLSDDTTERVAFVVFGHGRLEGVRLDHEHPDPGTTVLVGSTASHDHFLGDTPQCGDFDGDGRADLLFGESPRDEAVVVLDVPRDDRISLDDVGTRIRGFRVRPVEDAFIFADVVTPLTDLDGDGRTDFLVRMHTYDGETQTNWALFVLGKDDQKTIEAADIIAGEGGFAYAEPWDEGARAMFSYVTPAGDFDGNGLADIAMSNQSYTEPQVRGRVRLMLFDQPIEPR